MLSCKYWEISKKPILKNICVRLLLKRLQEVIDQDLLSGELLSKTSRLSNITKIPFAFKPEPSLNLTPTLYFELRFPIFIINGYDRKANACSPWTSCFIYASATLLKTLECNLMPIMRQSCKYCSIRIAKFVYFLKSGKAESWRPVTADVLQVRNLIQNLLEVNSVRKRLMILKLFQGK